MADRRILEANLPTTEGLEGTVMPGQSFSTVVPPTLLLHRAGWFGFCFQVASEFILSGFGMASILFLGLL